MPSKFPHCTYSEFGCREPNGCKSCGFDEKELERRKALPLTIGPDGLARKIIKKEDRQ